MHDWDLKIKFRERMDLLSPARYKDFEVTLNSYLVKYEEIKPNQTDQICPLSMRTIAESSRRIYLQMKFLISSLLQIISYITSCFVAFLMKNMI